MAVRNEGRESKSERRGELLHASELCHVDDSRWEGCSGCCEVERMARRSARCERWGVHGRSRQPPRGLASDRHTASSTTSRPLSHSHLSPRRARTFHPRICHLTHFFLYQQARPGRGCSGPRWVGAGHPTRSALQQHSTAARQHSSSLGQLHHSRGRSARCRPVHTIGLVQCCRTQAAGMPQCDPVTVASMTWETLRRETE